MVDISTAQAGSAQQDLSVETLAVETRALETLAVERLAVETDDREFGHTQVEYADAEQADVEHHDLGAQGTTTVLDLTTTPATLTTRTVDGPDATVATGDDLDLLQSDAQVLFRDGRARRVIDVVVALVAFVVTLPLLLILMIAVMIETPGPALFRQVRVGRGAQPFHILKLRSMIVAPPEQGPQVSGRRDPRVTRLGHLLRATKLDELPQLINIIRGDMTLIGPRPEVPKYVAYYTEQERALLSVRPGLTGAGALYGSREHIGALDAVTDVEGHYLDHQLHPKAAMDLAYLCDRRLVTDARILVGTTKHVILH